MSCKPQRESRLFIILESPFLTCHSCSPINAVGGPSYDPNPSEHHGLHGGQEIRKRRHCQERGQACHRCLHVEGTLPPPPGVAMSISAREPWQAQSYEPSARHSCLFSALLLMHVSTPFFPSPCPLHVLEGSEDYSPDRWLLWGGQLRDVRARVLPSFPLHVAERQDQCHGRGASSKCFGDCGGARKRLDVRGG